MFTTLPAAWVEAGHAVPDVCAKHGAPATSRRDVQLSSVPAPWTRVLLLLGVLPYLIVALVTRRTVDAHRWPFCPDCRKLRSTWLVAGWTGIVLSFVLCGQGLVMSGTNSGLSGALSVFGLLLLIVGIALGGQGNWAKIAEARVSRDGRYVEIADAHPSFEGAVRRANASMPRPGEMARYDQTGRYDRQPPPGLPAGPR